MRNLRYASLSPIAMAMLSQISSLLRCLCYVLFSVFCYLLSFLLLTFQQDRLFVGKDQVFPSTLSPEVRRNA